MSISLRDFRFTDLEAVHALNQSALPAVSHVTLDEMRTLAGMAAYFRVAEDGRGRIVAFLIGLSPEAPYGSVNFLWFRERYPSFVYVDRIVVGAGERGAGLGRRFYSDFEAFARDRAAASITCEVNTRPRNEASLAFHDRLGFEAVGEQETEGGKKSVVMLLKRLPSARPPGDPSRGDA